MDKIHETNMMTYRYREDWFIDIFTVGKFWQAWIYKEDFSLKKLFYSYDAEVSVEEFIGRAYARVDEKLLGEYLAGAVWAIKGQK